MRRWSVIVSTVRRLGPHVGFLVLLPVTVPTVLVIRLLWPFVSIRFGRLHSDRLGHLAANTDLFLCRNLRERNRRRTVDVFYATALVANRQLLRMWARRLRFIPFAGVLDRVNRTIPDGQAHVVALSEPRDTGGYLANAAPQLCFTAVEERTGEQLLQSLGVLPHQPFVCVHARDRAYLEQAISRERADAFRYHDYRDASITNYPAALKELVSRGYTVVRMGKVVAEALEDAAPPMIDYASSSLRSDFLDIYLTAHCNFFLGVGSGPDAVARAFRKPVAYANVVPIEYVATWMPNALFIPKKLWLACEKRFLTFEEIFRSGIGRYLHTEEYEHAGISVLENTPEEIRELAIEMDERLAGTWVRTREDEELQQRFWELFPKSELHGKILAKIGAAFLRENKHLLF